MTWIGKIIRYYHLTYLFFLKDCLREYCRTKLVNKKFYVLAKTFLPIRE